MKSTRNNYEFLLQVQKTTHVQGEE